MFVSSPCGSAARVFFSPAEHKNVFNRLRRGLGDLGEMQMDTTWEPDTWHFAQPRSLY